MPVADVLPFVHGIFFVTLQSALVAGLFLESRRERRALSRERQERPGNPVPEGEGAGPGVSVVIPLHNEESRLPPLLESLALQNYPGAEIILVDDRSADGTAALISRFALGREDVRILTLKENPGPNHKQYALGKGLEAAKGALFLFTDADCRLSPGWIGAMAERMGDPRTGAVIAPVFRQWYVPRHVPNSPSRRKNAVPRRSFLRSYQLYDHVVRFVYLAGAVGLGAAGGGFGNNLILRRAALEEAGGYAAVPPSPTEDAALISLIRSSTSYHVRSACGRETHVFTGSEDSWKALINQTLRWNNGGLFSPEPLTRINYTILMLTIAAAVLALLLLPFFPKLWPMPLAQLIVMLENTAGALFIARGGLGPDAKGVKDVKAVKDIKEGGRRSKDKAPKPGDPEGGPRQGGGQNPDNPGIPAGSLPRTHWIRELLFMPFYMTLMTVLGFCGVKTTWKEDGKGDGKGDAP
jgi:cellulose synthase/poly-beta-1,6-N-acetylglucosamine synthase-like glycosyltransferase